VHVQGRRRRQRRLLSSDARPQLAGSVIDSFVVCA
jgi:hypothetical protein